MENRKQRIQDLIDHRLQNNEIYICLFQILILNENVRSTIETLLKKYNYSTLQVDTVSGCWNLNDCWYEFPDVEAIVEFCGVYPITWDIDDVVLLEKLYHNRDIYIQVLWKQETENNDITYIPNM